MTSRPITRFNLETVSTKKVLHKLVLLDKAAEQAKDYLRVGSRVRVEGYLKTRFVEINKEVKIFITEVICETLEML